MDFHELYERAPAFLIDSHARIHVIWSPKNNPNQNKRLWRVIASIKEVPPMAIAMLCYLDGSLERVMVLDDGRITADFGLNPNATECREVVKTM